ncbi:MAG: GEVED domain-containing protein, partial [Verrucomicrobiales bacterium]|nr:GEVED domain-containing protein [Verrucomicrobiales bacterium]
QVTSGHSHRIRGNAIYGHDALGIKLGFSSVIVTQNDPRDPDTGPNQLQNFPELRAATVIPGGTRVTGSLNSVPNATFALDFFHNLFCDRFEHGEGERYVGSTTVTTDANGNATFEVTLPVQVPRGVLTATATDAQGNTSEFSRCVTVSTEIPPQTYTVTTTADDGPGSFREALRLADTFTTGRNTIAFNIPGAGVQVIAPLTPLPPITSSVAIDGFTQPGSSPNTLADGNNAVLLIRLDGVNLGPGADGLDFRNWENLVRGLILTRFDGDAIQFVGGFNSVVEGCAIGLEPGSPALPAAGPPPGQGAVPLAAPPRGGPLGNGIGVAIVDSRNNLIGGSAPAARNVISGNRRTGVLLNSSNLGSFGNQVDGNFIGTTFDGSGPLGNSGHGVTVGPLAGGTAGARHGGTIGPLNFNYIGRKWKFPGSPQSRAAPLGEQGARTAGPEVAAPPAPTIEGKGNRIGYNDGAGVAFLAGSYNSAIGNDYSGNKGIPIDLGGDGPTHNDEGDLDEGPNDLLNYPILKSAVLEGDVLTITGTFGASSSQSALAGQPPVGLVCIHNVVGGSVNYATALVIREMSNDNFSAQGPPGSLKPGDKITASKVKLDNQSSETTPGLTTITTAIPVVSRDYGDAPETPGNLANLGPAPSGYPTTRANNGASHEIKQGLSLGSRIDAEGDGQPTTPADGDDLNPAGADDEDGWDPGASTLSVGGLAAPLPVINPQAGTLVELAVTVNVPAGVNALLNVWFDFNRDGDWNDAGEHVLRDVRVTAGLNRLRFALPAGVTTGLSYARFRLSSAAGLAPGGAAPDGEVEDYLVFLGRVDDGDALPEHGPAPHLLDATPNVYLGNGVDPDPGYQPTTDARGDDTDADGDDEDGVTMGFIVASTTGSFVVTANAEADLHVWLDVNRVNGFEHPAEYLNNWIVNHAGGAYRLQPGRNTIRFQVPSTLTRGPGYLRFRVVPPGQTGVLPTGLQRGGEVEDYFVQLHEHWVDFGDAPLPYPTTLANNGAYHFNPELQIWLGGRLDFELDGQPHPEALGDDQNDGVDVPPSSEPDDEDGLRFVSPLVAGQQATINVAVTIKTPGPALLNAWMDFNQDSDWDDPGEQVLTDRAVTDGDNVLTFTVPADAKPGRTFARFRLSRTGGVGPTGLVISGEVEDYAVEITRAAQGRIESIRLLEGNRVEITWSGAAELQRADTVDGEYKKVEGATSPFTLNPTGRQGFFRLRFP